VAPGGKVVLVGYSGASESVLRPSTIMLKELDVVGVLSGVGTLDRALGLVERGAVRLDALSTAILPVRDHARAEELSGSVARVVLDCSAW
jgi:threonine dehydrogenase-like Zn-dependent dehydrogenase